jgi:hypothetical protein
MPIIQLTLLIRKKGRLNAINVVSYEVAMFQLWDETYSVINKREFIRINTASEQKSSVGRWLEKSP